MKSKSGILITVLMCLLIARNGWSAVRYENYQGGSIAVNVAIGRTSEIVFPELIAQLLRSQIPDSIDLEVKGKSLYILPKVQSNADIFVRTVSNMEVPINLVFKEENDTQVRISYAIDEPQKTKVERKKSNKAISLMKALIKKEDIGGSTRLDVNKVIFENRYFRATLLTKYELNNAEGLIVEIENLLYRSIITPIQDINLKNLIAIAAENDLLAPCGEENSKTLLYLVLRK